MLPSHYYYHNVHHTAQWSEPAILSAERRVKELLQRLPDCDQTLNRARYRQRVFGAHVQILIEVAARNRYQSCIS